MSTLTLVLTGMAAGATIYGSYMWLTRKKPTPKVNTRLPATFPVKRVEPAIPETLTERMVAAAMGKQEAATINRLVARVDVSVTPVPVVAARTPNATTQKAIAELETGKGKRLATVRDLVVELDTDDVWNVARQRHEPVYVPPVYHVTPDYSSSCSSRSSSSSYDSGSSSYSSSCDSSSSSSSDSGSCGGCD